MRGASNLATGGVAIGTAFRELAPHVSTTTLYYRPHSVVSQKGHFTRRPRIDVMAVAVGLHTLCNIRVGPNRIW